MKYRWLNKIYASLTGYFWLPCPLCKQEFGGHEWKTGDDMPIPNKLGVYEGICPDCGNNNNLRKKD